MKNSVILLTAALCFIFLSCSDQNTQPEKVSHIEENKSSILVANEELFNKGNLSHAEKVFSAGYAEEGPDWIKKYVEELRTAFPDIQVSVEPIIGEENKTAWLRTHTGTHQGAYMGFEPTNKKITWNTMIISEYNEDGLVAKEWAVSDMFEVLQKASIVEEEIEE